MKRLAQLGGGSTLQEGARKLTMFAQNRGISGCVLHSESNSIHSSPQATTRPLLASCATPMTACPVGVEARANAVRVAAPASHPSSTTALAPLLVMVVTPAVSGR